jgi:1-deoxy-D-xylulose-5-phosphate reductoisomerase
MKNISVLGSTGSIGTQTMDVVRNNKDQFRINSITANSNIDLFEQQIKEFRPQIAVIFDENKYKDLKSRVSRDVEILTGIDGLIQAATMDSTEVVVSGIVGIAGLIPTYNAVLKGKNIALANKETLVTAGKIFMKAAKEKNVSILPVDSEHSAIFQSIGSNSKNSINKLILTASGGAFRNKTKEELEAVQLEDALKHPNWDMGKKITIDSATLMNKGLEVIEARWLFDIEAHAIEVNIHPQSIIHSMVEFIDGSVIAQLGLPDMKLPIQYALTYPNRYEMQGKRLDLTEIGKLEFYKPDTDKFPCLRLAYDALKQGDSACVVLNSANEEAVRLFMDRKIAFNQISILIEKTLEEHNTIEIKSINDITDLDTWSRRKLIEIYEKRCKLW